LGSGRPLGLLNRHGWTTNYGRLLDGYILQKILKLPLSGQDILTFYESWIYNQGLCVLDKEKNTIKFNFPGTTRLLLNEHSALKRNKKYLTTP